jgi:dephospho-CoA kinase
MVVGITGGIAGGKSAAAKMFAAKGAATIDADEIARELSAPGGAASAEIQNAFGDLGRAGLRELVFTSPPARKKLEAILHPRIREEAKRRLTALAAKKPPPPYAMLIAPLLFEAGGLQTLIHRALVVDCDEKTQLRRALARGGWTASQIKAAMAAQLPRHTRRRRAADIINNSGDMAALQQQVNFFHAKYRRAGRAMREEEV